MFGKNDYIRSLEKRFDDLFQLFTHSTEVSAQAMTDLRREYEAKLEAERQRSRVMEQMFLDRLMSQAGIPQMYNTVPVYEAPENPEPETQGLPPGMASVLAMQQFEDGLFAKMRQEAAQLAEQQRQEAEASFPIPE